MANNAVITEIDGKHIIKGPSSKKNFDFLLDRYKHMVEKLHVPSERILVLLPDNTALSDWRDRLEFKASGKIMAVTFNKFIRSEIETYYPIILENDNRILRRGLKPLFSSFDISKFLITRAVEGRRMKENAFRGIAAQDEKIAEYVISNMLAATNNDIPVHEIGTRLFNSLYIKDITKKALYSDLDAVIDAYRSKCLELGIFDLSLTIESYTELLKDNRYQLQLKRRFEHILAYEIEEFSIPELSLIDSMLSFIKSCILTYNPEGGFSDASSDSHDFIKNNLFGKCKLTEMEMEFPKQEFAKLSEALYMNIRYGSNNKLVDERLIERNGPFELRSEMLENLSVRVSKLVKDEGYLPSDIVILSTYADHVTELVIGRILEQSHIKLINPAENTRLLDNRLPRALLSLFILCHPEHRQTPVKEDLRILFSVCLGLDHIRCSVLAREVLKDNKLRLPDISIVNASELYRGIEISKYKYMFNWIKDYLTREEPLPANEFIQKAFLELLISSELELKDISYVKAIISYTSQYLEIAGKFFKSGLYKYFADAFKNLKESCEILDIPVDDASLITFSTPKRFLNLNITPRVIVLTGISSDNWTPRNIKELSNNFCLSNNWDINKVYTEELEETNQKNYLANLIRAIIKRCQDKLITFESNLSSNGYENNGILPAYLDDIFLQ